ncbi:hypothetical protein ACLB2K_042367 [Fragaria x ananassa]
MSILIEIRLSRCRTRAKLALQYVAIHGSEDELCHLCHHRKIVFGFILVHNPPQQHLPVVIFNLQHCSASISSVSMGKSRGKGLSKRVLTMDHDGRIRKIENSFTKKKKKSKMISESSIPETAAELTRGNSASNVTKATSSSHANRATNDSGRSFSGFIFMCNGKTKPECYRNRVFGMPLPKEEVVKTIKQGENFLHRFKISKDCLPLHESSFRTAIRDNYQGGACSNLYVPPNQHVVPYPQYDKYEAEEHVAHVQPPIEPRHVVQHYADSYSLAAAHQPYAPENSFLSSHDAYRRQGFTHSQEMVTRDQVISYGTSQFRSQSDSAASSYELPPTYQPYYQATTHHDQNRVDHDPLERPLLGSSNVTDMPIYSHLPSTGATRYY